MALLLKTVYRGYFWLFNEIADPRADDFILTSTSQLLCVIALYLWFVLRAGPKFMANRSPFKLGKVLVLYNLSQVLLNTYMAFYGLQEVLLRLNWHCTPIDYSRTPHNMMVYRMMYLYFLVKLIDLLDTVFFVLKKNHHQISVLHVYHHAVMAMGGWMGIKFIGGGHSIFIGAINSFVHAIMYFYYFLTSLKPEYKRKLWWKKYITQLQIAQFLLFLVIYGKLLFQPECTYPKFLSYIFVPQNLLMLFMFADFYRRRYWRTNNTDA